MELLTGTIKNRSVTINRFPTSEGTSDQYLCKSCTIFVANNKDLHYKCCTCFKNYVTGNEWWPHTHTHIYIYIYIYIYMNICSYVVDSDHGLDVGSRCEPGSRW
jgi:hypothetical protein